MMFSIIIPVYNIAPYLRECLDSVLAQSFTDWECLCVDDGSTDGSGTILDEYATNDKRFRVLHQPNAGVGTARNAALDIARGKWIWFVDGDDIIHPQALRIVSEAVLGNSKANTVALGSVHGTTLPTPWDIGEQRKVLFWPTPVEDSTKLFLHGIWFYVMRREAIGSLRFLPFRHNEDGVFLYNYMSQGFGIVDVQAKVYFNRTRQGSAIHPTSVSAEMVRKTMETRRLQVDCLSRFESTIGADNIRSCWKRLYDNCFQGSYFGWYFNLSPRDRAKLLPQWLSLLKSCRKHYKPSLEQRIRVCLICLIPSGRLVKWFAIGWIPGLNLSHRIIYGLRHKSRMFFGIFKRKSMNQ